MSEEINIALTPAQKRLLEESRIVNSDAFEAYLRGMSLVELGTEADLERALDYFNLSQEIDPNYALAYHGISMVWGSYMMHGFIPWEDARIKQLNARNKALELDSSLVEIRASRATELAWSEYDWKNAEKEFLIALSINPNYAFVNAYYSHFLAIMGNPDKGLPYGELAIKLDPFNTLYQSVHGQALKNAHKYDEALEVLLKLCETEPEQGIGLPALWAVYHELGDYDNALEVASKIYQIRENDIALEVIKQ